MYYGILFWDNPRGVATCRTFPGGFGAEPRDTPFSTRLLCCLDELEPRVGRHLSHTMALCCLEEFEPRVGIDVTKPYEFIGFGAIDVTKSCEFIGFGAIDGTKSYEFIGFGGDTSATRWHLQFDTQAVRESCSLP